MYERLVIVKGVPAESAKISTRISGLLTLIAVTGSEVLLIASLIASATASSPNDCVIFTVIVVSLSLKLISSPFSKLPLSVDGINLSR